MKIKIRNITDTGVLLALLLCLQWVGSQIIEPTAKQLITGTLVNCVLAVSVLMVGLFAGITLSVVSPVLAYLWGIAPNFVTVLPIMIANSIFALLLHVLHGKKIQLSWRQPVAIATAATAKFLTLYFLVVQVICNLAAPHLLGKKIGDTLILAPPMISMLPAMFTWPQLITALAGGTIAMLIFPTLKKSNKR